ncbi:hypothetical protein OG21DRAFT_1527524 [Imleria badia]|nr:hypothetical protein OG21DRAFT_1527524 [Imleria badia]
MEGTIWVNRERLIESQPRSKNDPTSEDEPDVEMSMEGIVGDANGDGPAGSWVQTEPAASVPPITYPLSSLPQALPAYSTSSCKGKEHQTSPAPICTILPYEDIHNTEPVMGPSAFKTIQGTLFPEFTGQEYPKNTFEDGIMGPIHLYNSAEELHTIFKASHSEEEGRAPSYCQAFHIIIFLNHWRKHKNLEAKKKKEFLRGEEKQKRETELRVPPPPILIQALQEHIMSEPIQSPLGGSNTTLGTVTPIPLLARVNKQSVLDTMPASHVSVETTTRPQRKITLNFKTAFLPREAPVLTASINDWSKFIEQCQRACPKDRCRGLCKMFPGAIGPNVYPDDEDSKLNPSMK